MCGPVIVFSASPKVPMVPSAPEEAGVRVLGGYVTGTGATSGVPAAGGRGRQAGGRLMAIERR